MNAKTTGRPLLLAVALLAASAWAADVAPAPAAPRALVVAQGLERSDAAAGPDSPAPAAVLAPATAPSADDVGLLRDEMRTYFDGEHRTGVLATGLGLASLGAGIGLYASGGATRQGFAVPVMVMGALQLALGLGLSLRTPRQVKRFEAQLDDAPAAFAAEERARIARVNSRWWLYRVVEVTVAFSGIAVAGIGGVTQTDAAVGVGFALVAEAVVMLLIDHYAEARAHRYEGALLGFRF